jgi:hypothetical protein
MSLLDRRSFLGGLLATIMPAAWHKHQNEPNSILPAHINYMSTAGASKGFWPLFEVNPAWLEPLTNGGQT